MQRDGRSPKSTAGGGCFLPDLCDVRLVFLAVLAAQLLALVIALVRYPASGDFWSDLSLLSLLVQWLVLTNVAALCLLRRRLAGRSATLVASASLMVVLAVTLTVSELVFQLSRHSAMATLLPASRHGEFLLRIIVIVTIIAAIVLRYMYVQSELRRTLEATTRARIAALQARIRPHFLFNSMNTIASLTRSQPGLAEQVVEDLADLFRVALADSDRGATLGRELRLSRQYLGIEALRLGERLRVQWHTEGLPADARLPALTLQPLLENAVYHGIEPRAEGGEITISGRRDDDAIELCIRNPAPQRTGAQQRDGLHMALDNIRERLALAFARRAAVETDSAADGFETRIRFPYVPATEGR